MASDEQPSVRLRAALDAVPGYKPGRPASAPAGVTAYKVSSNENPFPPLPSVVGVIEQAAREVNRYPDMAVTELSERIAEALDVDIDQVATGTGSVAVLGQIVTALCDPGDEVIFAWRSFEAYPIVVALAGATAVMVGLDEHARHRVDAMAAAVTDRTKAILVCTPNNPTGPIVTHAELTRLLQRVPRHIAVVIDEAYVEFVTDPQAPRSLDLLRDHPNVIVLRTFSKAYGLAGLRVGYAVAHPTVALALRKTATPFGVNSLAQRAAVASLDVEDELLVRVKELVHRREEFVAQLRAIGMPVPDTQGNFVWLPLGQRSVEFARACEEVGLSVRPFADEGVRVTVAEPEANARLVEVASAFVP